MIGPRAYLVIDTETTGFPDAHPDVGPVQYGAALVERVPHAGWQVVDGINVPVRPNRWPPEKQWRGAMRTHGIPREQAERHPETPRQGYNRLMAWAYRHHSRMNVPLYTLAWNAAFDRAILIRGAGTANIHFHDAPLLDDGLVAPKGCLMKAWRVLLKRPGTRPGTGSLSAAADRMGVKAGKAHDALGDAVTASLILCKLLNGARP